MAAITPSRVTRTSSGDVTQLIAEFSTVSDADTYASGIEGIVSHQYLVTADPTTNTSAGANVALSGSTFTFFPGIDALTGTLVVLARS